MHRRPTEQATGPGCGGSHPYVRRQPESTVLHQVVRAHLETFLAETRLRGGGEGLPRFVEKELRDFLTCGTMHRGFARFRCGGCKREILVAFSCKGRGFCPSCCGRRMCALAAHLADGVLGGLPVRQWVLTLPHRLRYKLAYDHELCRAVLAVFVRGVLAFERRAAGERLPPVRRRAPSRRARTRRIQRRWPRAGNRDPCRPPMVAMVAAGGKIARAALAAHRRRAGTFGRAIIRGRTCSAARSRPTFCHVRSAAVACGWSPRSRGAP